MTAQPEAIEVTRPRAREARDPGSRLRWWRQVGWRHVVAILGLAFALFPAVWVVSASFNPTNSLAAIEFIPDRPTLANYTQLLRTEPFLRWMRTSLVVAGGAAVINTFLSALAAYTFSRMRWHGRRTGLMTILLVQMFPQLLAMVAIFLLMTQLKDHFPAIGLGTHLGLMLVYMGGALSSNTWLIKGFFDTIPKELDESAKVDGATHGQLFFRIILPLSVPILAVVALLSFVILFNEYLLASILIRDQAAFPLSVGLASYIEPQKTIWGLFTAGAMLGGLPVLALFLFLQRYIVSGLTSGAVKG